MRTTKNPLGMSGAMTSLGVPMADPWTSKCPLSHCAQDSRVISGLNCLKRDLRWQALYVIIRDDLHSTGEYMIVRELAATPVHPPVALSLSIDGERNEPRRLILSLEPAVS